MATLVVTDTVAALSAVTAALSLVFRGSPANADLVHLVASGILPLGWLVALTTTQSYDVRQLFVGTAEYERVFRSGVAFTAVVALVGYLGDFGLSRGYVVTTLVLTVAFTVLFRFLLRRALHAGRARGRWLRRVVVVGHVRAVAELCRQLRRERFHGLTVVGACVPVAGLDSRGGLRLESGQLVVPGVSVPVYGSFDDAALAVESADADALIVLSCPELDGPALRRLAWQVEDDDIDLIVASTLMDVSGDRITVRPVDGLPMLQVNHPRLRGTRRVAKALVDRTLGALLLTLFLPLIAALAVWVRSTSPGPAMFRQLRVGRDGQTFPIFKLRTMYTDAEQRLAELRAANECDGVLFKIPDDPRITRAGRFIRRFSLDELPQLINVVTGQMSLVGPRPPLPAEVDQYPADMRRRLVVKPGMTGLWQVSGRSDLSWEDTMRLDLRYVENWSLTLDLIILLRTITAVVRSAGAY
ncbi:MAG: sugar transferase [Actinocatenispora sp.]